MPFSNKFKHKAGDVRKYFKLTNWDEQEYCESKKREERLNELRKNEKENQERKSIELIEQKVEPVEIKSEFNMR